MAHGMPDRRDECRQEWVEMKHASFFRDQDEEISGIVSRFLDESMSGSGDALDARRAHLAVLASLIGCQGLDAFRAELAVALDDGLRPEEAREVVCQSIAYLGVGRSAPFVTAMYDVFAEHGVKALESAGMLPDDERVGRGSSIQAEMFGDFMKDAWKAGTVNRWLAANCFGDCYTRGNLTLADREMATFCYLMAQGGCEPQLEAHIKGNMNMGNDTGVLREVVLRCLPYLGYPRSLNAMACIARVEAEGQES